MKVYFFEINDRPVLQMQSVGEESLWRQLVFFGQHAVW